MATFSRNEAVRVDSIAAIQALIALVHDGMLTIGCVQTSDIGQIELSDVVTPNNTIAETFGYRMYELNDSMSVTHPVFIKITFGSGRIRSGLAVARLGVWVGFSTDGAGELISPHVGGLSFSEYSSGTNSPTYAEAPISAACKLDGYLMLAFGIGAASTSVANASAGQFAILRGRGADNSLSGDSVVMVHAGQGDVRPSQRASVQYQWIYRSSAALGPAIQNPFHMPPITMLSGIPVATPANLSDGERVVTCKELVWLPPSTSLNGSNIELSDDGYIDRTYKFLLGPTVSNDTVGTMGWLLDSRERYINAMGVLFE